MHAVTGLPWWATIALTTVAVKAALFPFTVVQAKHAERLGEAWPEVNILRGYLRTKLDEVNNSRAQNMAGCGAQYPRVMDSVDLDFFDTRNDQDVTRYELLSIPEPLGSSGSRPR